MARYLTLNRLAAIAQDQWGLGDPPPGGGRRRLAGDPPAPRQRASAGSGCSGRLGLGHLPADRHEFTLPVRRQSRRTDVRLHPRELADSEWISLRGLLVTRPARIAADLVADREDPEAVGQVIADAIRGVYDHPGTFADALAPYAAGFGLRRRDGLALLSWLLDLVCDPETAGWMAQARTHAERGRAAAR